MGTNQRTYDRTHPWLSFNLDLRRASHVLWMALGEAQSKCEHIAGVPLRPATAEYLHRVFLAKGALATTAIEGNTLTESEALQRLQGKLKLPPSKDYLGQEIDNIVDACNDILANIVSGAPVRITPDLIRQYNRQVLRALPVSEGVTPGEVRNYEVSVANYQGAPAKDCELLLQQLCTWLNSESFRAPVGLEIVYGLLKAVATHVYLVWIHPFGDGNGRTARLLEFQILVASGVPSPAAHLLSNYYNQTRQEYYRHLDKASKSEYGLLLFIEYAVRGFVDGLRTQLEAIRQQQWDVMWTNYIHETFRDRNGAADVRRRHLIVDLSAHTNPVPVAKLRELSPRVAAAYATKSNKTLSRDVEALEEEQLLIKTPAGVAANRNFILAFLPARRVELAEGQAEN